MTELETLAVVWALNHFHAYLYGNEVTVYTDHSSVRAVLETPNPSAKHARWWTKVYGSGIKSIQIVYRCGRDNQNADALSHNPQETAPREPQVEEVQVATINTGEEEVCQLLNKSVPQCSTQKDNFGVEQRKDKELEDMIRFLEGGSLPDNNEAAKKVAAQSSILYSHRWNTVFRGFQTWPREAMCCATPSEDSNHGGEPQQPHGWSLFR